MESDKFFILQLTFRRVNHDKDEKNKLHRTASTKDHSSGRQDLYRLWSNVSETVHVGRIFDLFMKKFIIYLRSL